MTNPIRVQKIGHVGLYCRDLPRMVEFYTRVLGFEVSDVNEKGMTFLRFGADHHSLVLAKAPEGESPAKPTVLQQIAMEVADLDTLKRIRRHLVAQNAPKVTSIKHEGPATITPSTSTTPKATGCSSSARWTRSAGTARAGRRASGSASPSKTERLAEEALELV